jgi:hypothetical protein
MKIFDTQPKPGMPVRHGAFYRAITRMARAWEGLAVDGGHVSWSGGKPTIVVDGDGGGAGETGGMDYSKFAFGFTISGAVVTVNSGKVRHGTRTPVTAAGTDITIAADNTWIFVAYTYGSTATITSSTSEPVDTEEVHNHALYLVTLTGTPPSASASVGEGNIRSLGDIFIPGSFG